MKKILIFVALLILLGIGAFATSKEDKQTNRNIEQTSQPELFTKEKALKGVQDYKIQIDLQSPHIAKGVTLFEVYEARGRVPAIKNLGWNVTEGGSGKFIVSFKQETDLGINEPRWEVNEDTIKAINGEALNYTPELEEPPKEVQGNDLEKQVYDTFSGLAKKYTDEVFTKYPNPTSQQLDQAEQKALSETATKYQITIEQVREIFTRLDDARYNL